MDKQTQGKKSRAAGKAFERKVRADLEKKGWIVCKWTNNVEFSDNKTEFKTISGKKIARINEFPRLIPAKHTFNPFTKAMSAGNGFPDFIAFFKIYYEEKGKILAFMPCYDIIGVESKMNGQLDKEEKAKCEWYLQNNIFSQILIASKGQKRGEIVYSEYQKI